MTATESIAAAINAKFASADPVITLEQAQTATGDYIVLFVSRRYVDKRLASGEVSVSGGRVIVRCCCADTENLDIFRARVTAALEDQILSGDVGPFCFETEAQDTDLDESLGLKWLVADSHWTF